MNECRYFGMCERQYKIGCDGIDSVCKRYEPMPNIKTVLTVAEDMESGICAGCLLVQKGCYDLRVDSTLENWAEKLRRACGI